MTVFCYFGGEGAWDMITVCGVLVVKECHRMAISE